MFVLRHKPTDSYFEIGIHDSDSIVVTKLYEKAERFSNEQLACKELYRHLSIDTSREWEVVSYLSPGDPVAYRTKDFHGYQWITAEVQKVERGYAHLLTEDGVALLIPLTSLTKIKTVWADTHKPVKE